MAVTRKDWLLFLLALRDASEALDPVRLQSGLFLLSRVDGLPPSEAYDFGIEDSGPFASAIDSDATELETLGLVCRDQVGGYTWSEFRATPEGIQQAAALVHRLNPQQLDALRELATIKQDILSLSFRDLMDHLVDRYPDFTRNSLFR